MAKKYKIIHEQNLCIGCYACESTEPKHWEMVDTDEGPKSHVKKSTKKGDIETLELDQLDNNMEAAEVCPVNCIHIEEDGERKI